MSNSYTRTPHPAGDRFAEAHFGKLRLDEKDAERIKKWIGGKKNFLVYIGNPGIGKTYFCSALYNLARSAFKFETVRYWNERQLFNRLRSQMENGRDYLADLQEMCDDELLIFDDLGSSGITDWRKEVLFELVDFRYSSNKPTIFTSNLSRDDIYRNLGERLHSRMFARGNTILEIAGADLRQEEEENESK